MSIPNFVDTDQLHPSDRMTDYRAELGIGDAPVVLYAGNVGLSQSLDLVLGAARRCPDVVFVINGDGAARPALETAAADLSNVRFVGYQPIERLPEVLASGDVHVVPLRAGLGDVSVPSKTYSSLAVTRPVVACDRSPHGDPSAARRIRWWNQCAARRSRRRSWQPSGR